MSDLFGIASWRDADADVFVAYCAAFDLYSQGETRDEALHALYSAASMWLKHTVPRRLMRHADKPALMVRRG